MSKFTTAIQARKQNYTTLRSAFMSESGAIDLASIMVGIIVIGLIGGVIAATVFAVIPWSQDNAAKHQLESIHTAQNAFYGLSSDPAANLTAGKVNSFSDSPALQSAALLSQASSYCAVPSADGQNYTGYVKSASGKIFYGQNSSKTPKTLVSGVLPCTTAGAFDPALVVPTDGVETGAGSGGGGATPPVTVPETPATHTTVYEYGFEDKRSGSQANPLVGYSSQNVVWAFSSPSSHSGTMYARVTNDVVNRGIATAYMSILTPGEYRISVWVYSPNNTTQYKTTGKDFNTGTYTTVRSNTWTEVVNTVYISNGTIYLDGVTGGGAMFWVDDIKIEKKN